MSFEKIAKNYLIALRSEITRAHKTDQYTAELSYRPELHKFFQKLTSLIDSDIDLIHESKNIGRAGRPDWRFSNAKSQGIYGYVEAKGLDLERTLTSKGHENQIKKYVDLGHNLIFTDGLDFIFYFASDPKPRLFSLLKKPVSKDNFKNPLINTSIESQFVTFFKHEKARHCTEDQIIQESAKRAKILSESLEELANLAHTEAISEEERKTILALRKLKELLKDHHDPTLSDSKLFADFVSQVLIFGLIYAHRVAVSNGEDPKKKFKEIGKFWSDAKYKVHYESITPFKALLDLLSDDLTQNSLGPLGTWYNDCKLFLSFVRLDPKQRESPDYHALYEKFLGVFNPKQKFDYGAFYTPKDLANYTVMLSKSIHEYVYHSDDLFENQNKLIDPCCGTGSFLEELVKIIPSHSKASITGLEILPAPYTLAKYRMLALSRGGYRSDSVKIFLTNTLSDDLAQNSQLSGEYRNLIEEEQGKARDSVKPPLILIVGNPPSSDPSFNAPLKTRGANFSIIEKLIDDFRPPVLERTTRQNTQKQITNEFMKFLRWSCDKIIASGEGIISLVLPSSFLEHSTYRYARKWLCSNFSFIFTLDIDEDGRVGSATSSIFNTLQGRSLVVAVKSIAHEKKHVAAENLYCNISTRSKQEKIDFLIKNRSLKEYIGDYSAICLGKNYSFRPKKAHDENLWNNYWPLYPSKSLPTSGEKYVFSRHVSAVKMGATALFVHVDEGLLRRRCKDIANYKLNYEELKTRWYDGQDKPPPSKKLTPKLRSDFGSQVTKSVLDYAYRPFLNVKAVVNEKLFESLSKATGKGSGTRSRPELQIAFSDKRTMGIAVTPGTKDVGVKLHRFSSFCWNLPDNDLCKRGNAQIFCNLFPDYKNAKTENWDSSLKINVNPELISSLADSYNKKVSDKDVVFYIYAILCSQKYLDKFEGILFSVANTENRPRIPFPISLDTFQQISEYGEILAIMEDFLNVIPLTDKFEKAKKLFSTSFALNDKNWFEESNGKYNIVLGSMSGKNIIIPDVAEEIIKYAVSGYSVIGQWLKMYSYRYKRVNFDQNDYYSFLSLLTRIDKQIKTIRDIDSYIEELFDKKNLLS